MHHVEINEVVLVHCNIVNNDNQHDLGILCTCCPNRSFDQLLDNSLENGIFSKVFNWEFSHIELCFTGQNSKLLGMEDKINIILVIN